MTPTPQPFSALRQFQIRLMSGFLLSTVAIGWILFVAGLAGLIPTPPSWNATLLLGNAVLTTLWWALRRFPASYVPIASFQMVSALILCTYALWQPLGHELRVIWYTVGVGTAYLLLGRAAGVAWTASALAMVVLSNHTQPTPYSSHALIVFSLAVLLSSAGFFLLVGHGYQLYRRLSDREQMFTLLTENAKEVIWRVNPDMTVAYVSPADERARGYAAAEVVGRPIFEALGTDGAAILREAIRTQDPLVTLPLRCRNGEVRWFEMSARLYRDALGQQAGYLSIGRDVTRRLELEKSLEAERNLLEARVKERTAALSVAKEAAEAALRAKSIFLSNIGHELRTPMTLILGTTELVHSRLREERLKPMLQGVMDASRNLMRLLNELIDLAVLESRQVKFNFSPFSMPELAANAVALVEPLAREKGLGVSLVTGVDTAPAFHVGDPERIQQVLVNLLDNAVKFSHAGHIRLHAELSQNQAPGEDQAALWILRVEDQGIGIAQADQDRIFTLFEQVDGSATRAFEGAGLGLALCKRLVEGMGGSIGVESEPGQGSCFWVKLPLARAD